VLRRGPPPRRDRRRAAGVDLNPSPDFVIALGELSAAAGDPAGAPRYELADAQQRLFVAAGRRPGPRAGAVRADHGGDLAAALAAARGRWPTGPASTAPTRWPGRCTGRATCRPRWRRSRQARRLGTRDALIFSTPGRSRRAGHARRGPRRPRPGAVDQPELSVLHAPEARRTLSDLGGRHETLAARLLGAVGLLAANRGAGARPPLGNFTVNHSSAVEVAGDRVRVRQVMGLPRRSGVPGAPEGRGHAGVRGGARARRVAAGLRLTVDAAPSR